MLNPYDQLINDIYGARMLEKYHATQATYETIDTMAADVPLSAGVVGRAILKGRSIVALALEQIPLKRPCAPTITSSYA